MRRPGQAKLPPAVYLRLIDKLAASVPGPVLRLKFIRRAIYESFRIPRIVWLCPPLANARTRKAILRIASDFIPGQPGFSPGKETGKPATDGPRTAADRRTTFSPARVTFGIAITIILAGSVIAMKAAGPFQPHPMNTPEFPDSSQSLSATPPAATPASDFSNHTLSLIDHDILQSLYYQPDFMPFTGFKQAQPAGETGERSPFGHTISMESSLAFFREDRLEFSQEKPETDQGRELATLKAAAARSNPRNEVTLTDPKAESKPNNSAKATTAPPPAANTGTPTFPEYLEESIWLVEKRNGTEFYSNRLQIITSSAVKNVPRSYYRFRREDALPPNEAKPTRTIAGLLYHTSESDLFPFRPDMNQSISKYSQWLIRYTGKNHSYHYLIDRFGRVFRIVAEGDAAFHAGNSVWADRDWLYLNLNHAFLGICFEGKDAERIVHGKDGKKNRDTQNLSFPRASTLNDAQLKSGRELTDWLRVKYRIPQQNCVTHGLASINPRNRLIGYHLDLSTGFPFERFRLNNKNMESLPSITELGFSYDTYFLKLFDGKLWPGIHRSEAILQKKANEANLPLGRYRKQLTENFTTLFDWQNIQQEKETKDKLPEPSASLQERLPKNN